MIVNPASFLQRKFDFVESPRYISTEARVRGSVELRNGTESPVRWSMPRVIVGY